jgi:tetratricopeptide (TPR) repeat protein
LKNKSYKTGYQAEIEDFANTTERNYANKSERQTRLAPLFAEFNRELIDSEDKEDILKKILKNDPGNGKILMELAFLGAINERWEQALEDARAFLKIQCRENRWRLSIGLLEVEILHLMKQEKAATDALESFFKRTRAPLYKAISEYLLGRLSEQSLLSQIEENRENLVIWHSALGFWAEGSGNKKKALKHYREALGSYMDTRIEYEFAKERIKRLRRSSGL